MSADKSKERDESRRLVEEHGKSLPEAAAIVGVNARTVRRWQKADEQAGDPWALGGRSAEQRARAAGLTDEQRAELAERARQAAALRWENRRRAEADAAGVAASALRQQTMNALPRLAASLLEDGSQADTAGLRPSRLAMTVKSLAIAYAVMLDKADRLAGVDAVALVDGHDTGEVDLAEVQTLFAQVRERRGLRAV